MERSPMNFTSDKKTTINHSLKLLPFLVMPLITPIYNLLDSLLFVDIFGCGCVPSAHENMLGIAFNANDLRLTVYAVLSLLMTVWGWRLCGKQSMQDKKSGIWRIIYVISVLLFNLLLGYQIWRHNLWA